MKPITCVMIYPAYMHCSLKKLTTLHLWLDMVHGLVAKVCKCEIEIQAKIGSANTEIHKKIDNTNIHNFVTECGLEQTIPEIECVMTVSIAQLKKCLLWRLWTISCRIWAGSALLAQVVKIFDFNLFHDNLSFSFFLVFINRNLCRTPHGLQPIKLPRTACLSEYKWVGIISVIGYAVRRVYVRVCDDREIINLITVLL